MGQAEPRWLKMLFRLFAVNYKTLWTDALLDEKMREANDFLWTHTFKDYAEDVIMAAAMSAIKTYHYPPSIQQFSEIVSSLNRNKNMDVDARKRITGTVTHNTHPPSPLVAEYMAKHPPMADDSFKQLFSKYQGEELGRQVIMEIKRKLRGSHAQPNRDGKNI